MSFQPQKYSSENKRVGVAYHTGVYEAIVMANVDAQLSGRLQVYIPELGGSIDDITSHKIVRYASPFYGITPHKAAAINHAATKQVTGDVMDVDTTLPKDAVEAQDTLTSYGMWMVPPDLGVVVLVTFINGDPNRGFWFACVPGIAHGMVPAIGAPDGKTPLAEFNPLSSEAVSTQDLTQVKRNPYEPLSSQFEAQGLKDDPLRGPITTSSFRESPSKVFGFNTQAGHSFAMDDGSEDGKSKLIRIRTAGGNQITMHDDNGMIYLTNAKGTGWIELSPEGNIDIYGEAGINLATKGDINMHADKNIKIHAGECLQLVAMKGAKLMGAEELQLHGKKTMIEGVDALHIHSCTEIIMTSYADIHIKAFNYFCLRGKCFYWNSCEAKESEQVPPEKPEDKGGYKTTVKRAPTKEPFKEHAGGGGGGGGASNNALAKLTSASSGTDTVSSSTSSMINNGLIINAAAATPASTATNTINNNSTTQTNAIAETVSQKASTPSGVGADSWGKADGTQARDAAQNTTANEAAGEDASQGGGQPPTGGQQQQKGCFAQGVNCERPVDQTGQGSGDSGGNGGGAQRGQKNFVPPASLKNDPAFQAKLAEMKAKYPGLTDQQLYNVIGGESGFNWKATNPSGATGGFQFMPATARSLGYTTAQIQNMSPSQQLGVYDQYLSRNNYSGGALGIMQAAPKYANYSSNAVVYSVGSAAWRQNPGWRGSNGQITVGSINSYYGY